MKTNRIVGLLFSCVFLCLNHYGNAQSHKEHEIHPREWPALKNGEKAVCHSAYCLLYSEEHEQAIWVAYELTAEETLKSHERSDKFITDPKISTGSATKEDYTGSGFDRGHIAPAADMGWSENTMQESFFMSNMSPQRPKCNRGIWKKGEEQVRDWAKNYGQLYVVAGPVLKKGLPAIGANRVSVPELYYKVLLRPDSLHPEGIGLIIANEGSKMPLKTFAVSIDSVERLTGLDFFPWMSETLEAKTEARLCLDCWSWGKGHYGEVKNPNNHNSGVHHENEILPKDSDLDGFQCHGITKKGKRCKRKVRISVANCYQHGG